tara:strand:- start:1964 stop:2275 length:312 start_codon:yes stop_codon:yes gene_type:complete
MSNIKEIEKKVIELIEKDAELLLPFEVNNFVKSIKNIFAEYQNKKTSKRYSTLQNDFGAYRVKDYKFGTWIDVEWKKNQWVFKDKIFRTAPELNEYLKGVKYD